MTIMTLIRSVSLVLLSALHLGPAVVQTQAEVSKPEAGAKARSSTSASASAHASASASSTGGQGGCRAESSSVAEVRSDGRVVRKEDHDSAEDSGGGCSARAESRARAENAPTD